MAGQRDLPSSHISTKPFPLINPNNNGSLADTQPQSKVKLHDSHPQKDLALTPTLPPSVYCVRISLVLERRFSRGKLHTFGYLEDELPSVIEQGSVKQKTEKHLAPTRLIFFPKHFIM